MADAAIAAAAIVNGVVTLEFASAAGAESDVVGLATAVGAAVPTPGNGVSTIAIEAPGAPLPEVVAGLPALSRVWREPVLAESLPDLPEIDAGSLLMTSA